MMHCRFCDGKGRDESHRVCLHCKGTGLEDSIYPDTRPKRKQTKKERAFAAKMKLVGWVIVIGYLVEILGAFKWDWSWIWVVINFVPVFWIAMLTGLFFDDEDS
jgi:sterol desaturase/sphingolipid hydroxylase (fatty acid hydroxylase superfamily)